jgi:hypothetical protein
MARYTSFFQAGFTTAQVDQLKRVVSASNSSFVMTVGAHTLNGNLICKGGLDAGTSGSEGNIDIFPATAAKGKFRISCADQTGDTIADVNMGAQAGARTFGIKDPSTLVGADTNWVFAMVRYGAGAPSGFAASIPSFYVDTANGKLYSCTAASATSATFALVGSQS